MSNISLVFVWLLIIVVFGFLRPHTFLTVDTFRVILSQQAITAIMSMALLLPIAANQFDLSIAGTMGMSVVVLTYLMAHYHVPWPLAMVLTIAGGLIIGVVNSIVVVAWGVNSFIATLGSNSILIAVLSSINGGQPVTEGIPTTYTKIGQSTVFSIPVFVFYMLVIALILWYVLEHRQTGRYLYAMGSNSEAARLAGVRVRALSALALIVSALLATIAGLIFVMRIGSGSVDAGTSYLLPAFAAAFLGATQFKDGKVNVLGTLVAVYALATGVKGVQLMGAPFWVQGAFNGAALVVAVALAARSRRRRTT
ncbi:MAG: transporter permease [Pseudonocardiales bacterium]|nr:transporter permease [Pseudonocardiales bacterium]